MNIIPLTQGFVALVDDADFDAVSTFKWQAQKNGRRVYATRNTRKPNGTRIKQSLHHFLMPGIRRVDHINGDGLDNQRHNLRPATHQQNCRGFRRKRVGTYSQYRGVTWHKSGHKWVSQIGVGGKDIHLGLFRSEIEAAQAYNIAAKHYFGGFASINTI